MRILVTGATGFVGNTLLPELQEVFPDAEMTAFVLPDDPFKDCLPKHKKLFIIEGDITDKKEMQDAVKGHSHVIHLAGLISYWKRDHEKLIAVNRVGVENIVEGCLKHNISKLIHISSVGAYGFNKDGRFSDEDTPFNWPSHFHYMVSKFEGQKIVEQAIRDKGLNALILNPASIMGPGDPNLFTPHNQLYNRIYNGPLIGCFSGGLAVVDVRDLVRIIIKALDSDRYREKYLVVGANVKYTQVVKAISRHAGKKAYPFPVPSFLLSFLGICLELLSSITHRRPLLTRAYGKLSGWKTYYSNEKSKKDFNHDYIPFEQTIEHSCRYFEKNFL
jgi:nucleoside-diphosphate-sugar epimerase